MPWQLGLPRVTNVGTLPESGLANRRLLLKSFNACYAELGCSRRFRLVVLSRFAQSSPWRNRIRMGLAQGPACGRILVRGRESRARKLMYKLNEPNICRGTCYSSTAHAINSPHLDSLLSISSHPSPFRTRELVAVKSTLPEWKSVGLQQPMCEKG